MWIPQIGWQYRLFLLLLLGDLSQVLLHGNVNFHRICCMRLAKGGP